MTRTPFDVEQTRNLGHAVAVHSHDDLPAERFADLEAVIETATEALETEDVDAAGTTLLDFWAGLVATETGRDIDTLDTSEYVPLIEEAFESGVLGIDLYQALSKVATATTTDRAVPEVGGWVNRLLELTNRHVAHLQSHH